MEDKKDEIFIDVQMRSDDFAKKAADVKMRIDQLRKANKDLQQAQKEGTITTDQAAATMAKNDAAIKNLQVELRSYTKTLQGLSQEVITTDDSLNGMRAQLVQLKNEYGALTKAERDSVAGQELRDHIAELNDTVKAAEAGYGDFQRNVGNYTNAINNSKLGKFIGQIQNVSNTARGAIAQYGSFGNAIKVALTKAGSAVKAFGRTLLTTPIGWIAAAVAALVAVFGKLKDAIAKNDNASTALARVYAVTIQPAITLITKFFEVLAERIAAVANVIADVTLAVRKFFGGAGEEAAKAAEDIVVATDNLEEAERQYVVNSAKRNKDIARLRNEAQQTDKLSAEERKKRLEEAVALEQKNLEDEKKIASEHLRILEETARQEGDTSDATKDKIAEARAAMYKAEEAYFTGTQRLQQQLTRENKEIDDENSKRAEERRRQLEERLKLEKSIAQQIEDFWNSQISDQTEREIAERETAIAREIDKLREQLKDREKLTEQAYSDLLALIKAKEEQLATVRQDIQARAQKEQYEKEVEAETDRLRLRIELATKGTQEYYDLRITALQRLRDTELAETRKTDEDKLLIEQKYSQQLEDIEIERQQSFAAKRLAVIEKEFEEKQLLFDRELATNVERAQAELEREQAYRDALRKSQFASIEEYEKAVIESDRAIIASKKKVQDAQVAQTQSVMSSTSTVFRALSETIGQFGEENEKLAAFSKTLALFQIGIDTAKAIAGGVAQAQSVPFPANLAAIAATIATVVANIGSATSLVKGLTAPKFANGGVVEGTSTSGDKIVARLNANELVSNPKQQANLLYEISNNPARGGMDYEMLGNVLADAVASLPAPVMVYKEFTSFEQRTANYKDFARI